VAQDLVVMDTIDSPTHQETNKQKRECLKCVSFKPTQAAELPATAAVRNKQTNKQVSQMCVFQTSRVASHGCIATWRQGAIVE